MVEAFNLNFVQLEPAPKPSFLTNATHDAVKQFMAIFRLTDLPQLRKVSELDVMVGTLRPEVQYAYQDYKADAVLHKIAQDEQLREIAEKTHYTIVHLEALRKSERTGSLERKKRMEMMFTEYSKFVVQAVTSQLANVIDDTMKEMLRALMFTERMIQRT
ncbi:hypothetical protein Q1695_011032 [Nippostrongylus brasiliensis]|nr:hypothetical protein Q1695_011032 [Nippostrongylus brasiliensis]